jgi:hypothetical protein
MALQAAETQKALNPPKKTPPEPKTVDTGDGVFQYNEDSGRYDIKVGPSKKTPVEQKVLGVPIDEIKQEIAANPGKYPGGFMEGAAGFKNTQAAAQELLRTAEAAKRAPEKPEKPTAEDKAVSDHLAAQGLADTPANRDKARMDLATGKVTAAAEAKGNEQKVQLRESATQSFKNMNALYKQDTDPANYGFLMSFIGMMYEGIRGARLNRAEIERAAATRSLPDQLQKSYDLYIQKKILTPQQKDEMLAAATAVASTYGKVQRNKKTGEIRIVDESGAPATTAAPANAAAPGPQTITIDPNAY